MKVIRNVMLAAIGCFVCSAALADALAGYWKHAEEPAWIEIRFENGAGTGTVRRNDNKPEAVGRVLLKELVNDEGDASSWSGQIYAERFKEYKDAAITLTDPDHMQIRVKVGFMSRTVDWTRAPTLPAD